MPPSPTQNTGGLPTALFEPARGGGGCHWPPKNKRFLPSMNGECELTAADAASWCACGRARRYKRAKLKWLRLRRACRVHGPPAARERGLDPQVGSPDPQVGSPAVRERVWIHRVGPAPVPACLLRLPGRRRRLLWPRLHRPCLRQTRSWSVMHRRLRRGTTQLLLSRFAPLPALQRGPMTPVRAVCLVITQPLCTHQQSSSGYLAF